MRKFSLVTGLAALATVGAAFSSFITGDFWFYENEEQEDIAFGITIGGGDVFNIGGGFSCLARPTEGVSLGFAVEQVRYAIDPETGEKTDVMVIDQIEDCDDIAAYFSPNVPGTTAASPAHHFGIRVSPKVFFDDEDVADSFYNDPNFLVPALSVDVTADEEEFSVPDGYMAMVSTPYSISFLPVDDGSGCFNALNEHFAKLFPTFNEQFVGNDGVMFFNLYGASAEFSLNEDGDIIHRVAFHGSGCEEYEEGNCAPQFCGELGECWEKLIRDTGSNPSVTRVETNCVIFDEAEDFEEFVALVNNTKIVPELYTDGFIWTFIAPIPNLVIDD